MDNIIYAPCDGGVGFGWWHGGGGGGVSPGQ